MFRQVLLCNPAAVAAAAATCFIVLKVNCIVYILLFNKLPEPSLRFLELYKRRSLCVLWKVILIDKFTWLLLLLCLLFLFVFCCLLWKIYLCLFELHGACVYHNRLLCQFWKEWTINKWWKNKTNRSILIVNCTFFFMDVSCFSLSALSRCFILSYFLSQI